MRTRKNCRLMHLVPDVVRMRSEGLTFEEIGERLKLSRQRICQIEQAAQRHEDILRLWGFPFSARTFNCIEKLGIENREHALELYNKGHIQPGVVRGFGWVSYHEICEWLGVPTVRAQSPGQRFCIHCGKPT